MFYQRIIEDGTICLTGYKGNSPHVEIPVHLNVSILGDDLFKNHLEITSITIPDTVTQIGGFVFDGCENLKVITLPPNLKAMWQYALTRSSMTSITIPGTVKSIIPFTFNQCRALTTVIFNAGTESISAWAFKDCTALRDVFIPSTLRDISDKAFDGCPEIQFHQV